MQIRRSNSTNEDELCPLNHDQVIESRMTTCAFKQLWANTVRIVTLDKGSSQVPSIKLAVLREVNGG
jgi:hypothetical protein